MLEFVFSSVLVHFCGVY